MHSLKKTVAMLIVLALCVSLFSTAAFASEKKKYSVVNLGDSTNIGIGLNDCGIYSVAPWMLTLPVGYIRSRGFLDSCSPRSYAALMADYVRAELPEYDVSFTNLGRTGMRACEFRKLLSPEFEADGLAAYYDDYYAYYYPQAFDLSAWDNDVHRLAVEAVRGADLILVDASMNSFTDYLTSRFSQPDDPMFDASLLDLMKSTTPAMRTLLDRAEALGKATLGAILPQNAVTNALDTLIYCLADMFVNFDGLIRDIRALNPDATILCGGLYDPFRGMKIEYQGFVLELDGLFDAAVALGDSYLSTFCPSREEYIFFDVPNDAELIRGYMRQFHTVDELSAETIHAVLDDLTLDDTTFFIEPMSQRIQSLALERGIDCSAFGELIEPWDAENAILAVRTLGDAADEASRLIAEEYAKVFRLMLDGIHYDTLDVGLFSSELMQDNHYASLQRLVGRSFSELSPTEKSYALYFVDMEVRNGAGLHFSENGCRAKFEAAKAALKGKLPVPPVTRYVNEITDGLLKTVVKSIQLTVKNSGKILGNLGKLLKR